MGRFDSIFEKGGKGKMGEEKKFVAPEIKRVEIESRTAKKPIFKPKGEVSDECLAALRASSEVIGEKCKFTPSPRGASVNEALPFLEKLVKEGVYSDIDEAVKDFKIMRERVKD